MSRLRQVGDHRGPAPVVHPETEPFWRGLAEGRLRLQRCTPCGTVRFPLGPVCWRCGSFDHEWTDVATAGTVSAAVTVRRATGDPLWAGEVPLVSAQIDMDSAGVRLPGRILCDPDTPPPHGTPVDAAYLAAADGYGVLCFVLRESSQEGS
ncbi:MAG: OB-fold domain-containing protein [Pseudonocardia sp.]|uniref:Zn-ribbon domain-containing OB-fold protein n=1 Tax=unclassified Pseudonocardia TaxID=2619320 RepID=UPI00086EBF1B|nr:MULTISPECIES: zinc ribbon domain-containing protein [unclassified Pseudonocardia]MBN9110228.1 OB-fold domain-containing protein [Pseudonocardia sp.]ODU26317.1 MAG: hypothetical protein ABS80_07680 [Pseudonocardia sp. SCN 72-51]ODV06360.1 MAG: hypothetical protein ABT15_12665 [Pseudonocardia sp. SCN 73-27]